MSEVMNVGVMNVGQSPKATRLNLAAPAGNGTRGTIATRLFCDGRIGYSSSWMCRKIAVFVVCAEILLSRAKVSLESRAGPFLGFVQKY